MGYPPLPLMWANAGLTQGQRRGQNPKCTPPEASEVNSAALGVRFAGFSTLPTAPFLGKVLRIIRLSVLSRWVDLCDSSLCDSPRDDGLGYPVAMA